MPPIPARLFVDDFHSTPFIVFLAEGLTKRLNEFSVLLERLAKATDTQPIELTSIPSSTLFDTGLQREI